MGTNKEKKNNKVSDLIIITAIYLLAFAGGFFFCYQIDNIILKYFAFDIAATVITFAFSVVLKNSSVYDAYWSLTPMVMSVALFIEMQAFGIWQILFLIVFNIWSIRLTLNWVGVFTDFSYEDWRYRKFRDENGPFMWFFINFTGIHMVPTLVVFGGMLPLFEIAEGKCGWISIPGMLLILLGVAFEFFADRQMHEFLSSPKSSSVCRVGLWNHSRHPNYLGEITVWIGTFCSMIPYAWDKWFYIVGAVSIIALFNFVSIPLMEKRQLSRRPEYSEYKKEVSRLLLR